MIRLFNIPSANITLSPNTKHTWRLESALLLVIVLSLFTRTVAYNYDFSQSLKDNARNYNPFHKPVKSQPLRAKMPRALSSITLPMAQSQSDICSSTPLVKTFPTLSGALISLFPQTHSFVREKSTFCILSLAAPPNLCVLNATFRI